jgi:hypothetical protein
MCKVCLEAIKTDVVAVGNVKLMSDDGFDEEADRDALNGLIDGFPDDDYFGDKWNER